jgi:hypothetical protein
MRQMVWNQLVPSYMRSFVRAGICHTEPAHLRLPVQPIERDSANRLLSI